MIPFHIELRRLYAPTDRTDHELGFGVVGVVEPVKVTIASEDFQKSRIVSRSSRGHIDLNDQLLDSLALKCFELMAGVILDEGGDSGWWTIADITRFVRNGFPQSDSERILRELSGHVTPRLKVRNICLVADDDAI